MAILFLYNDIKRRKAFSLIELSIVIIIISLVIAGVTAGFNLVKSFQLQKVMTDTNSYKAAINTFKLQYNYLPGDLPNAESYWPSTNNGDGDRRIDSLGAQYYVERILLWQQLSLAKLIPGAYTGRDTTANRSVIGTNVPRAAKRNIAGSAGGLGFEVYNNDYWSGQNHWWTSLQPFVNYMFMAGYRTNNSLLSGASISPVDAYNLDIKYDDGLPVRGKLGYQGGLLQDGSWSSICQDKTTTTDQCLLWFSIDSK